MKHFFIVVFLLLDGFVLSAQEGKYTAFGLNYFPFHSKIYIPQVGFYAQRKTEYEMVYEFSGRIDFPRRYEWPGAGKYNMINSRFNLMLGGIPKLYADKNFRLNMLILGGIGILSSRRLLTRSDMRDRIVAWNFKSVGIAGFIGIEGNLKLGKRSGFQFAMGAGSYFFKLGYVRF